MSGRPWQSLLPCRSPSKHDRKSTEPDGRSVMTRQAGPRLRSGNRNGLSESGLDCGRGWRWSWSGRGTVAAVLGSGFEVFVESSCSVLVEAGFAAGALGVVGRIVGGGRSSGRNVGRGPGGSVPAVPAVSPGQPRGRPAPRHANPTVGPDPTQPNPCQVPPRTPKRSSFRSCVSPESTSAAGGQVGHVPQPAVFRCLVSSGRRPKGAYQKIPYARRLYRLACRR